MRHILGPKRFIFEKAKGLLAPAPRFVICGTGRCGTGSAAQMLANAGVVCGHEAAFTPWGYCKRWGLTGDVSWLAQPHLKHFRGIVVHLVRAPQDTVQSMLDTGKFDPGRDDVYVRFLRRRMPLSGNPVDDAYAWYVYSNRGIEPYATVRFKITELVEMTDWIAQRLGMTPRKIDAVRTNPKTNQKKKYFGSHCDGSIASIASPALRREVGDMAARYGLPLSGNSM